MQGEAPGPISIAFYLAWSDIKASYCRSFLGPIWMVLTTAIGVIGLGLVWSELFHLDKAVFIPSLTLGLVVWQFMSQCIVEAPIIFAFNHKILKNTSNSIILFPLQLLFRHMIVFAHNFILIAVVLMIYPPQEACHFFFFIVGFLLFVGNLFCATFFLAIVGGRYRDLDPAVKSMISILFFLSPILYRPHQLGVKAKLMWLNPISYLITLIREPLLGHVPPLFVYHVSIAMLLLGVLLIMVLMRRYASRVAFWV
jgi:ABC-type polysaccharide/polyol phosphate export permease